VQRKILMCIVVALFIICGVYIFHFIGAVADVREAQYQRGIEFETMTRDSV